MSALLVATVIILYFLVLIAIARFTSKSANNDSFFVGNRQSSWYLVAFGMIGASLSGVTFLSIPGVVGNPGVQFSYMQVVLGYFVGYLIVSYVLLPIYYAKNLTSIYTYLEDRFGTYSHKTGAVFFLGSRILGASIRLLLVANVLQLFLFDRLGVPFELTVVISIALIWVYTHKGGIKTIIWTDTLQTLFMLAALVLMIHIIADDLGIYSKGLVKTVKDSPYSQWFFFEEPLSKNYFWKHFIGGMFITIGMTGLDQDMMQKNLSCKNIKQAQLNMVSFAAVLIVVNLIFLVLGALLYFYAEATGIGANVKGDVLFPTIALHPATGATIGVIFLVGLIAAAYSSADSALTALTTSISFDLLNIRKKNEEQALQLRKRIHFWVSVAIVGVIILLKYTTSASAIDSILFFAGFTYGPLIGLFFLGILTKRSLPDRLVPWICLGSALITILLWYFSAGGPGAFAEGKGILGSYYLGYELIAINAVITYAWLWLSSKPAQKYIA